MAQISREVTESQGATGEPEAFVGKSPGFWGRFKQDKVALVGLGFTAFLTLLAFAAPLISKYFAHGPNDISFANQTLDSFGLPTGPSSEFWFGVDLSGRDLFARTVYGARTSLLIAVVATGISVFIGVVLGMAAGYFRGGMDTLISRLIDIILSVPLLLFAVGIAAACSTSAEGCLGGLIQPGLGLVVFIVAFFSWPYIARIVRGNTLSIREKEFIEASRSVGAGHLRVMFREILPNLVAPIIVYSTLVIPANIIFEASLSFLGIGVPQDTPSWGRMLAEASEIFEYAWWMMVFPGLFLFGTVLAFNLLGDGLRDALDPRSGR